MSLILDALRRAESQRQRTVQPALSLPDAPARREPASLPVLAWLAMAGAVVLLTGATILVAPGLLPGTDRADTPADGARAGSPTASPLAADRAPAPATAAAPAMQRIPEAVAAARRVSSLREEAERGGPGPASRGPARADASAAAAGRMAAAGGPGGAAASRPAPGTVRIVPPDDSTAGGDRQRSAGGPSPAAGRTGRSAVAPGTMVVRDLLAEEGIPTTGTIAMSGPRSVPPGAGAGQPAGPGAGPAASGEAGGTTAAPAGTRAAATKTSPPPTSPPPTGGSGAGADYAGLDAAPTEFTLNMLSTSANPARSYVYINMRRYHIGDQTPEGAVIEDINNRGAVIAWRGERFLLALR